MGAATAIYFLLEQGQRSHWHRVDAAELWLWHAGDALEMSLSPDDEGPVRRHMLGDDIAAGEAPQLVIPQHEWQAAYAGRGWALVSCVFAPAFQFEGFELAAKGWSPGAATSSR